MAVETYHSRLTLTKRADFDQYGCAIAMALGKTQKEFVDAYAQKVVQQNEETLNADNVTLAFLKYCQTEVKGKNLGTITGTEKDCVQLSPTELYAKVSFHAQEVAIDVKAKGWPRSLGALTRRLNPVAVALKAMGCEITSYESTPRQIKINAKNLKVKPKPETVRHCVTECKRFNSPECPLYNGKKMDPSIEVPLKCPSYLYIGAGEDF